MSTVDNLIAIRILYLLVTPFEKTKAFELGIIDKDGNQLRKVKDLKTQAEKDAYDYLDRLVFNLKRLLAKVPGGKSQFASIVAAYYLIRESYENKLTITEDDYAHVLNLIENKNYVLVEEEILVKNFLETFSEEIVNVTGPAVSTDQAAVRLKNKKPVSGILTLPKRVLRRKPPVK